MIYTIGHKPSYDQGLLELGTEFKKIGYRKEHQGKQYLGGSVWRYARCAFDYLQANQPRLSEYGVYSIDASWTSSTRQISGDPFRRLIKDSPIVFFVNKPKALKDDQNDKNT